MHSMYLAGVPAPVHVTATDPLCAERHTDLITSAVVASGSPYGVSPMTTIVTRLRRIVAARVADAVMDGVMPAVIVIGVLSSQPR